MATLGQPVRIDGARAFGGACDQCRVLRFSDAHIRLLCPQTTVGPLVTNI